MKIKITLLLLCCYFQISLAQNIKGKVSANNLPIANVEIINISTKEVVNSNNEGLFEMKASVGNWISFYHKNYDVVKIYIDSSFNYTKTLDIKLTEKTIQIEEVVVEKKNPVLGKISTGMPVASNGKPNVHFNDGSIPNGINFVAIFGILKKIFTKKDKVKPKEIIEFRAFTSKTFDNNFLVTNLKLQPEDIESFLIFCDFDPKAKEVVQNSDKLAVLEFLMNKSEEYKTIHQKK